MSRVSARGTPALWPSVQGGFEHSTYRRHALHRLESCKALLSHIGFRSAPEPSEVVPSGGG